MSLRSGPLTTTVRSALRRPPALAVLAERDFRWFFISASLADLGLSLRFVALGWVVLELTDSAAWVGLVIGIRTLPTILLSLHGGAIADRVPKRHILILTRLTLAALAFLAGLLISSGSVEAWHLLLISIGIGFTMAFSRPAGPSWIPNLVPRPRLVSANALLGMTQNTGEILGAGLGGWLIGTSGADTVFYVVAAVYAASFLTLTPIENAGAPNATARASMLTDIRHGLAYAAGSPVILGVLIINLTSIFATALMALMPVYARDVLDVGATGLGVMGASLGAGFLAGSLTMTVVGDVKRKAILFWIAGAMWDFAMAGFAFSNIYPLSLALLFIMGIGGAVWTILAISILQSVTTDEMRGRVMSLWAVTSDTVPLGAMLGGFLAATVNNWFPLILGAAIAEPIIAIYILTQPKFRRA